MIFVNLQMLEQLDSLTKAENKTKVNCTEDLNRIATKDLFDNDVCGSCIKNYVGDNYNVDSKCLPPDEAVSMNKKCPNDCSNTGTCIFFDTNDASILDACKLQSNQCDARCECNNGTTGYDCSKSFEELYRLQYTQEKILDSIISVTVADSRIQTTEVIII